MFDSVRASASIRRAAIARAIPRPMPVAATPVGCPCGGFCPRCVTGGQPLPAALRVTMESRLDSGFADVRIHTDDSASRIAEDANARAVTIGEDIFFARGRFTPETTEGRTRLAHELVHVAQQRKGPGGADAMGAEREARALGPAIANGARATVRASAPVAPQFDGPDPDAEPAAPTPLQIDPELQSLMFRHYVRWWLGTTLVDGTGPSTLPPPDFLTPGIGVGLPGLGTLPPPPIIAQLPLEPQFFSPLPPDRLFLEPDVGSLFTGFGERGAPVGPGDSPVLFDLYRRNEALVRGLPDLRSMAPSFLRPLIPLTWRRDIAGALVGAAVSASLKRDFASPIEVSDRAWEGMTGASTTVIPFPSISF